MKTKTVAVSGGFDPIHVGHVRMILDAASHGDVVVILNSDEWLKEKKGYAFMGWEERAEIIRSIRGVVNVVSTIDDNDGTVCNTLRNLKKDLSSREFAKYLNTETNYKPIGDAKWNRKNIDKRSQSVGFTSDVYRISDDVKKSVFADYQNKLKQEKQI